MLFPSPKLALSWLALGCFFFPSLAQSQPRPPHSAQRIYSARAFQKARIAELYKEQAQQQSCTLRSWCHRWREQRDQWLLQQQQHRTQLARLLRRAHQQKACCRLGFQRISPTQLLRIAQRILPNHGFLHYRRLLQRSIYGRWILRSRRSKQPGFLQLNPQVQAIRRQLARHVQRLESIAKLLPHASRQIHRLQNKQQQFEQRCDQAMKLYQATQGPTTPNRPSCRCNHTNPCNTALSTSSSPPKTMPCVELKPNQSLQAAQKKTIPF